MAEIPAIVLPHGGYKKLIVYRKSETMPAEKRRPRRFRTRTLCEQLPAEKRRPRRFRTRTFQPFSEATGTSLLRLGEDVCLTGSREYAKAHADWEDWQKFFETRDAEICCNLMIVIIQQTKYLLDQMIKRQEEDFKKFGGVRERMHAARTAARAEDWDKAIYSRLNAATTVDELRARLAEIRREADRAAAGIARRKGWAK